MPAWSTEIANELIAGGACFGRSFDQIQLQKLVYIAHGWCLAISGQPLTGDRPEAWDIGPMYRRLADALAPWGREPILNAIEVPISLAGRRVVEGKIETKMGLLELDVIRRVSRKYGSLSSPQLSLLTSGAAAPWHGVHKSGVGRFQEISHALIRDQFVQFAQQLNQSHDYR